jgi:hypothetical protein
MRKEKTQNNKIRNKKSGDNNKHQGNSRNHYELLFENLYSNKLKNLEISRYI